MYKTAYFCTYCNQELTYHQKMHSHGRCQKCGYKSKSAVTIVSTNEKAYKEIKVPSGKWWKQDEYVREFLS